eukprot:gene29912-17982_t
MENRHMILCNSATPKHIIVFILSKVQGFAACTRPTAGPSATAKRHHWPGLVHVEEARTRRGSSTRRWTTTPRQAAKQKILSPLAPGTNAAVKLSTPVLKDPVDSWTPHLGPKNKSLESVHWTDREGESNSSVAPARATPPLAPKLDAEAYRHGLLDVPAPTSVGIPRGIRLPETMLRSESSQTVGATAPQRGRDEYP